MRNRRSFILFSIILLSSLVALADDKPKAAASDEKAMMEAWMKAATPADAHKKLDPFVGSWDVTVKSWMAPGAPAMEDKGTAQNSWILGNRYIEERYEGTFMGMPYTGIGTTGYDNIRKSYTGSWMDNMSTAAMTSTGSISADGKTFTFDAMNDDPMTGKPVKSTEKITIVDADHHTMEMWTPAPDGTMFKAMELSYTRKK